MIALLLAFALQAPDPIVDEAKFRSILDRAEKTGLVVPDLPDAVAELDALARSAKPPFAKELLDRHAVVRAQAAVVKSLHAMLLKHKGAMLEIPISAGKLMSVKIVEVSKRSVKIQRPEALQEFGFAELDAQWALTLAPLDPAEAPLLGGLWLARSGRWEAAFAALGDVTTDHPLAVEARKKGVDASFTSLDAHVKSRQWRDALGKLGALDAFASDDARLAGARAKVLEGMVDHGKELCRKGSKGPMQEILDLLAKHFPDDADRAVEVKEASRWIKITDPKRLRLEGMKGGPPWLFDPGEKQGMTQYVVEEKEKFAGISATFRFEGKSMAHAGIGWTNGARIAWVDSGSKYFNVGQGKAGESITAEYEKEIKVEGKHTIVVRVRAGDYVIHYNGVEQYRMKADKPRITEMGLNCQHHKIWVDEVLLLKSE